MAARTPAAWNRFATVVVRPFFDLLEGRSCRPGESALNESSTRAERSDPRIQAALREYLERLDRGERVEIEEFLSQHAEIAAALRSFIAAEHDLRKLAAGAASLETVVDSTRSLRLQDQETYVPHSMARRGAAEIDDRLGGQFGRYRILRTLGKGAMGTVYLAEDTQLNREVALKTPHFKDNPSDETLERFYREARAAATLRNAHICSVFDVGQIGGTHYLTMAYIDGHPLSAFINPDKPQSERHILIAIRKLALALHEAHAHGIVHRDLKPANIMVDRKGEPIIMDFGLARQISRDENIRLTESGIVVGTPAFMSPEQIEGIPEKIGPSTDQYSLGVVFYELLTGQLPFRGTLLAVMAQVITQEVLPPSRLRPGLDPRIEAVCLKMVAKKPADRYASMSEVADELENILRNPAAKAGADKTPVPTAQRTSSASQAPTDPDAKTVIMKDPAAERLTRQSLKSLKSKSWEAAELASLEEVARKAVARGDYEQAIEVIECIPENRRSPKLQATWTDTRGRADGVTYLICELDAAVRLGDEPTARRIAAQLLKLKPGHRRAQSIKEELAARGKPVSQRTVSWESFTQQWKRYGWIRWAAPALGLAFCGLMLCAVLLYFRAGNAVLKVEIDDPNVEVAVKGSSVVLKAPGREIEVEPGETELAVRLGELHFNTKSFSLKKGEKTTVKVALADSKLAAKLGDELLGATSVAPTSPVAGHTTDVVASSPPKPATDRKEFTIISGDWHLDGDQLVQTLKRPHQEMVFGDVRWTDYDFTVDAMRIGRGDSFTLFFRRPDRDARQNQYAFDVAGGGNRQTWADIFDKGKIETVQHRKYQLVEHRWYTARVKVRGSHFECFVNDGDKEVRLVDFDDDRHPNGCVGLRTWNAEYRFKDIKVTAPDGTVLWEGLPTIP